MRQRVAAAGRRLFIGHTTAVAYLALVLASSSVTYAAATIGSAEVINNALKSVDLADGLAVGGVDVINDSLTGSDVKELSLKGVGRKLVWSAPPETGPGPTPTIATVGGYTVTARCSTQRVVLEATLYVRGPAGDIQRSYFFTTNDGSSAQVYADGRSIQAGFDEPVMGVNTVVGEFSRIAGTVWVQSGTGLVQLDFHLVADRRSDPGVCRLYGSMTELV